MSVETAERSVLSDVRLLCLTRNDWQLTLGACHRSFESGKNAADLAWTQVLFFLHPRAIERMV